MVKHKYYPFLQEIVKTSSVQNDFFLDPLMVRVQPVGAVASLNLDLKQGSNLNVKGGSISNAQPPPLPPRFVSSAYYALQKNLYKFLGFCVLA